MVGFGSELLNLHLCYQQYISIIIILHSSHQTEKPRKYPDRTKNNLDPAKLLIWIGRLPSMLQDKTDDVTWFIFNFFFVVVHSDDLQTSALLALALRVLCAELGGGGSRG